ncbi:5851_t:CDS:2 [Ambispora gerdemannii]|uniref:5851_t:CDS:1 n=1 Tax=Ambispora gerdemannii TaxID=144530 RepID=A0A9N9DZC7_9GLOM|nr:5851_t:CDS:2 [Ambispora gerdemannii]
MSWQIPNGTIFFFLRVLISVLKKGNYQKLLVVFDGGGTNFRERIFSQYKAHRVADDIIASFVSQKQSMSFFDVFTRDKDLLQLINEEVNILKYIDSKITLYTQENFRQEYGFPPSSYIDYLSLLGDNVDNIEGIKGIGPVSAKNLIQQFGTVENIYQQIDNVPENSKKLLEESDSNRHLTGLESVACYHWAIWANC